MTFSYLLKLILIHKLFCFITLIFSFCFVWSDHECTYTGYVGENRMIHTIIINANWSSQWVICVRPRERLVKRFVFHFSRIIFPFHVSWGPVAQFFYYNNKTQPKLKPSCTSYCVNHKRISFFPEDSLV